MNTSPGTKPAAFTMNRRLAAAEAKEFTIEEKFNVYGYRSREDASLLNPTTLVYPSQNVLTDVFGYVGPRQGFTLYGQNNETLGSELLTNGSFSGNANGWTLQTDWAYNNNNVTFTP